MGGGEEDCRTIPAIDLKKFPEAEEYRKLREASETWGCFRLVNHMIPPALMSEMISVVRSLLDLPMEIKKQNKEVIAGSGYLAPSKVNPIYESLGFHDLGSRQALDSFCSQLNASSYQREVIEKYAQAVCEQIVDIGQKLTESLGLADSDYLKGWPCQFRINKYTFTSESVGSLGLRSHTDSGFLTILQDDEIVGGLEVMDKSGAFVAVDPCPGTLLVNLGDVAHAWSNGRLCNVKHRVQFREARIRVSISPFQRGPDEEAGVEAPPELVDSEHPRLYVPFTYEDYRKIRLSANLHADWPLKTTKQQPGSVRQRSRLSLQQRSRLLLQQRSNHDVDLVLEIDGDEICQVRGVGVNAAAAAGIKNWGFSTAEKDSTLAWRVRAWLQRTRLVKPRPCSLWTMAEEGCRRRRGVVVSVVKEGKGGGWRGRRVRMDGLAGVAHSS
ncbi:hypothetical protein FF1_026715 [Malus domestica]